jgi:hypothetical protein
MSTQYEARRAIAALVGAESLNKGYQANPAHKANQTARSAAEHADFAPVRKDQMA